MRWSDAELDEVIEEVIVDAFNDSEQLTSFECAFQEVDFPIAGRALGRSVAVVSVLFDGDPRRGLRARLRVDEQVHELDLLDVSVADEPLTTARLVAAYRRWLVGARS